jgi:hypothetical protein
MGRRETAPGRPSCRRVWTPAETTLIHACRIVTACDIRCSNDIRRIGVGILLIIAYGTIGGHENVLVKTFGRDLEYRADSLICQDPKHVSLRREAHERFPRIVSCPTKMILRWQSRRMSRVSSTLPWVTNVYMYCPAASPQKSQS